MAPPAILSHTRLTRDCAHQRDPRRLGEYHMPHPQYDLAIVGGGLAGASLGFAMAREGAKVLILEREATIP